jgi:hypothetical protein
MAKRGRPRKPKGLGLDTEIKVRVLPSEKEAWDAAAKARRPSMALSAWIREACTKLHEDETKGPTKTGR